MMRAAKKQRGTPPDENGPPNSEQTIPDEVAELTVQIKEKEIDLRKLRHQIQECEKLEKDIPERLLRNESSVLAILASLQERLTLRERPSESAPRLAKLSPNVAPDSRKRGTILPSKTVSSYYGKLRLHLVNRDEAMRDLLRVHRSNLAGRMAGGFVEVPLMDALFGMGKTTFAHSYLALVARYVANLYEEQLPNERKGSNADSVESILDHLKIDSFPAEADIVERVLDRLSNDISLGNSESDHRLVDKKLIADLLDARTMYLDCSGVSLLDRKQRGRTLVRLVRDGLKKWGITLPRDVVNWGQCVGLIPKPVFIVFDSIGKAFTKGTDDLVKQRECFFQFVSDYCDPLSRTEGVYYLLCGRAPFLWDVGMQPGIIRRINLNPIRKEYYAEILANTFIDQDTIPDSFLSLESIVKRNCSEPSIEEIIEKLYLITCGHSRSLLLSLHSDNPTDPRDESDLLLGDVDQALKRFPEGIKELFENRHTFQDLTRVHQSSEVTLEYLATRIHAGFGSYITHTTLHIPPLIESYLMRRFLPFIQFVLAHERILEERNLDKSRAFESIILKWLESVFSNPNKTVGELLGDFIPQSSILHSKSFTLDPKKTLEGCRVFREGSGGNSISSGKLASNLLDYFANKSVNIYFPAKMSYSPHILILPQIEDGERFLIGMHSEGQIGVKDCIEEAERFYDILQKTRRGSVKKEIKGVLLLCATWGFTQYERTSGCRAIIWSHPDMKEWIDFEVIILNLSTASSRKEFFNLALGADHDDSEKVTDLIERVVSYAD